MIVNISHVDDELQLVGMRFWKNTKRVHDRRYDTNRESRSGTCFNHIGDRFRDELMNFQCQFSVRHFSCDRRGCDPHRVVTFIDPTHHPLVFNESPPERSTFRNAISCYGLRARRFIIESRIPIDTGNRSICEINNPLV